MYYPKVYKQIDKKVIKQDALQQGFQVSLINDKAGFVYKPHTHPETKYLVFLSGSMDVTVNNQVFKCSQGDKLIVPGNTKHSAIVGQDGCSFFWSEKVL